MPIFFYLIKTLRSDDCKGYFKKKNNNIYLFHYFKY